MQVHDGKNENPLGFNAVDHAEGKAMQTMAPDIAGHDAESFRRGTYP